MRLRRTGVAAAVTALALTAGCGQDPRAAEADNLTEANFAAEVAEAQRSATTSHVEARIDAQGQQFTMSGDVDSSDEQVGVDMTMSGAALAGGNARFVLLDRVVYLQVPGMVPGEKFLRLDLRDSDTPGAEMLGQLLDQVEQMDPAKNARMYEAITRLRREGTQEVDGVRTTHYVVTVDTRKALQAMGVAAVAPAGRLPETMTQDVWLDGDNRIRRLRMEQPQMSMELTYSRWGEPVDIAAPPPGQVISLRQLMRRMGGSPSASSG